MYCQEGPFMTFTFKFINSFIEKRGIKAFTINFSRFNFTYCFP